MINFRKIYSLFNFIINSMTHLNKILLQNKKWKYFLARLIFISLSLSIYAEERTIFSYYIEWQNVSGAKGYIIQIKDKASNTEREEKLTQNNIELKVPAGYYEYRIASINKFGKPSTWTNWEEFYVEKDKPRPNSKDAKKVVEEKKLEEPKKEIKKWKWFVPSLTQFESKQKLTGSLWLLWFTGLAIYANSERVAGNQIASDKMNDPVFLSAISLGFSTPVLTDLYLREKRNEAKAEYEKHQSNQAAAGVVAILSYALQVWHAKRVADKANTTVEINARPQASIERAGGQVGNSLLSFEIKFTMSY